MRQLTRGSPSSYIQMLKVAARYVLYRRQRVTKRLYLTLWEWEYVYVDTYSKHLLCMNVCFCFSFYSVFPKCSCQFKSFYTENFLLPARCGPFGGFKRSEVLGADTSTPSPLIERILMAPFCETLVSTNWFPCVKQRVVPGDNSS